MSKIEYVTKSWNPICGCSRGCSYCYARRMLKRFNKGCDKCKFFIPHYHIERITRPLTWRKPQRIFLGSLTDLFAPKIELEWIEQIIKVIKATPQHRYITLTKWPVYPKEFIGIKNLWTGRTIEGGNIPRAMEHRILNIEPWLRPLNEFNNIKEYQWVIIGAQTNPSVPVIHNDLVSFLDLEVPLFIKNNVGFGPTIQQYPDGLKL